MQSPPFSFEPNSEQDPQVIQLFGLDPQGLHGKVDGALCELGPEDDDSQDNTIIIVI